MRLIVGLGNPDKQYLNTFHNLGFMCVDRVAKSLGVDFSKEKFRALIAEYGSGDKKTVIAKPLTYMNLSGESVREIVSFYKIEPKDIFVIYDDFDLKKGYIRIRESGSAGTHNGMRNIIKEIGTENFPRLRIGFKPEGECRIPLIDLVLSGIKQEDEQVFNSALNKGAEACVDFINGEKISSLISKYNGK